jgi:23S rRNA (cytidine2498-2'-O)-methyltransferase
MKGNLLLRAPGQAAEAVLGILRSQRTWTLARITPVQVLATIGPGREHLQTLGEAALAVVDFGPGDTFRVDCRRRGVHAFTSQEVPIAVGQVLEARTPATFRFRDPDQVVSIEVYQDVAYIGCTPSADTVLKPLLNMRIHAPGQRPLNRAESKLREALEAFGVEVHPGMRALDLGAAPGGWTKVLAEAGAEVVAVDPADLDPGVAALPRVTHVRAHGQDLALSADAAPFDLLTNDMNLDPDRSAAVVLALLPWLRPRGAVIMTVKFMSGRRRALIGQVMDALGPHFLEQRRQHLPHNARETTVLFRGLRATTPAPNPGGAPNV